MTDTTLVDHARQRLRDCLVKISKDLGATAYQLTVFSAVEDCLDRTRRTQTTLTASLSNDFTSTVSLLAITDTSYGPLGQLRLYGSTNHEVEAMKIAELACWIASMVRLTPEMQADICMRAGMTEPLMVLARTLVNADSVIAWQYRPRPGGSSGYFKFIEAVGLPEKLILDIPAGRGIVGSLTAESSIEVHDLLDNVSALYHSELVLERGWKTCETHALGGGDTILGALVFYFSGARVDPTKPGYAIAVRACLVLRQALHHRYQTQAIQNLLDEWQIELADRASKLQSGLAVLGLAHDLTSRADQLEIVASTIADVLPDPGKPDGRVQLNNRLISLGVGRRDVDQFMNFLGLARENAFFIKSVIDQVNLIARAKSRGRGKASLKVLVEENRLIFEALCRSRAEISFNVDDKIQVRASAMDLTRILLNTIGNAINWRASTIKVRGIYLDDVHERSPWMDTLKGKKMCMLSIRDDGDGMSQTVKAKALQPFSTERTEGTGLGLFVVDYLARELGGFVKLWSATGEGTAVQIILPTLES